MRKIIIIGTLHSGSTPEDELEKVLQEYDADQIFVEISEEDIGNRELKDYPKEMVFAFNWAEKKGVKVNGYDPKTDIFRKGMTELDNKKVIEEQEGLMEEFNWKDMNKVVNLRKLDTEAGKNLVDPDKAEEREFEMLGNIEREMIHKGVILILTGCGHLDFFEKHIKGAIFPFR